MNFYQMNNLKIIFFGTPDFSLDTLKYLHNSNHKLISVVSSADKKSGRGLKIKYSPVKNYCIQNQISLLQPENLKCIDFQNDLKNLKADLYVIVAFKFLPKEVWSIPKMGSINIHASLLPNLRGAAPINWSLIYGHNKTGLTSFFLDENIDTERFTSIDIRIYDLEKDIKNLTLQFEEILFKLDDISNNMADLESELILKLEKSNIESKKENIENYQDTTEEDLEIKEKNTLGKIVISDNIDAENDKDSSDLNIEKEKNSLLKELSSLNPEEQMQYALDQMMKKNYNDSKNILDDFIKNFPENQLSGSAHFWLGKIYLFETNYRKAAIVFGEGVQKFPNSIKAPEMYYELAKSLKEMDKISESCKTLALLAQNYEGNKFTKDPEKIKDKLNCD